MNILWLKFEQLGVYFFCKNTSQAPVKIYEVAETYSFFVPSSRAFLTAISNRVFPNPCCLYDLPSSRT